MVRNFVTSAQGGVLGVSGAGKVSQRGFISNKKSGNPPQVKNLHIDLTVQEEESHIEKDEKSFLDNSDGGVIMVDSDTQRNVMVERLEMDDAPLAIHENK